MDPLVEEMITIVEEAFKLNTSWVSHSSNQVVAKEDLVVGRIFAFHHPIFLTDQVDRWLCLNGPYLNDDGDLVVAMVSWPDGKIGKDFKLTDLGVVPYEDGNWHQTNWLEKTTDTKGMGVVSQIIRRMKWCGTGRPPYSWE